MAGLASQGFPPQHASFSKGFQGEMGRRARLGSLARRRKCLVRRGAGQGEGQGQGGRRGAYLAGEGLAERLPVGAERGPRVVPQQVLQPRVGAVLAQHHVAAVPELGQQEVAAASPAPGGPSRDQTCSPTPPPLRAGATSTWRDPSPPRARGSALSGGMGRS